MLSYQHAYHAGNFADVLKHSCLIRLLEYLCLKEKGLFYLETHSGRGIYDLTSTEARKTGEAASGIELLWANRKETATLLASYLAEIDKLNTKQQLSKYPGSPYLAIQGLREQDRLVCCELHPGEFTHLEKISKQGKRVSFLNEDGLSQLIALLPPPERRGLIFVDPSFEIKTDYKEIPRLLESAHKKFSSGVYCLWYPIIDKHYHETLLRGLKKIPATKTLRIELYLNEKAMPGMQACGLWLINPPFSLKEEMRTILQDLVKRFNPGKATYILED